MKLSYRPGKTTFEVQENNKVLYKILMETRPPYVFVFHDLFLMDEVKHRLSNIKQLFNMLRGINITNPDDKSFYSSPKGIFLTTPLNKRNLFNRYSELKYFTMVEFYRVGLDIFVETKSCHR